ncbi:MAG: long-chain fatty acid--CoA ligase [Rhodospirillaceae bacterium]|nr:long-chain fatty acid--CoA ligase [Rhodospirillaceae bacterium]
MAAREGPLAQLSYEIDTQTVGSLPGMFYAQARKLGDRPFLWEKEGGVYRAQSWTRIAERVSALAHGLKNAGVRPGDRVMLVAENRPEWLIADVAIMAIGGIAVPTYTTNTAVNHLHIINDSGARIALVSTAQLARHVIAAAAEADQKVTVYVYEDAEKAIRSEVEVHAWAELTRHGHTAAPGEVEELKRGEVSCLIYTSGTGGLPRGVMLTHGNILANCYGATDLLRTLGLADEVFLSFLPLSPAYEHSGGQFFPMSVGAQLYYAERIETLPTNMQEARPTIMTAVPRLYESMRARILQGLKTQSDFKRKMFDLALELGRKRYEEPEKMSLWDKARDLACDKLVRSKISARFGGRLKAMVSGGAPLNYDVGLFFIALGIPLLQGYGQTEAAPVVSANPPKRVKLKTVGPPLKGVQVKIADDGEILVRGELVMKGYWNDPDGTIAVIDEEGWLHTGDIGCVDEDGYIEITDRKKDIIVNSGGDNVSPQRIQGILCLEDAIEQAMAYGDKRPYITALIVPRTDFASAWAQQHGQPNDLAALVQNPEFRNAVSRAVEHANLQMSPIEKVRKFALTAQAFTIENGQLTPSLKVRRHAVLREYRETLDNLY